MHRFLKYPYPVPVQEERDMDECEHKTLKFTNPYADSYECKDCGKVFVVRHDWKAGKRVLDLSTA